jgi:type II secretory pathway predicted ATPase ExeA
MHYCEHWSLALPPFVNDHAPEFFVATPPAAEALARLRMPLAAEQGLAVLLGGAGAGKTSVLRHLLGEFADAGWTTAYLPRPDLTAADLLARIAPPSERACPEGGTWLAALERFAAAARAAGQRFVVAVDDAHLASRENLEALRAWLNIEDRGRRALNLLLAGQPPLWENLRAASAFDGQAAARVALAPCSPEETRGYLARRLQLAGGPRGIFTRQAVDAAARYASGRPRQINRVCDLALLTGFGLGVNKIDARIVGIAAADLALVPDPDYLESQPPGPPEAVPSPPPADDDILAALAAEPASVA